MNGGTNKNAAAAPKKVANPYAKKSKKATSSNTPTGTTANHITKNVPSASASVSLSLQQYSSSRQNNLHTIADPAASFNGNDGSQAMQCIPIDAFGIHEHMALPLVLIVRSQVHSSMNE